MDYEEGEDYGQVPTDARETLDVTSADYSTFPPSPANPSYLGAVTLHRTGGSNGTTGRNWVLAGTPGGSWGGSPWPQKRPGCRRVGTLGGTGAGGTTVTLEILGATDGVWASPAFLQAGGRSTAWQLNDLGTSLQGQAPGLPQGLTLAPATGGLDVDWAPPVTGTPRGYVLQWRKGTSGAFASRALFGPVTRAEAPGARRQHVVPGTSDGLRCTGGRGNG